VLPQWWHTYKLFIGNYIIMATVTSTSLGVLLKQLYAPWDIEQLLNLTHPVVDELAPKGSAELGGSGFRFAVRTRTAEGTGFIGQSDDLPAGGESTVLNAVVVPKVQAGVVQLTGLSRAVSSGNPMAFARAFEEQIGQTLEVMMAEKEEALFGNANSVLATFVGNPAASVGPHTVDDVAGLREGMSVAFYDTALTVLRTGGPEVISEVDWVAKTVTFDAAIDASAADTDVLVKINPSHGAAVDTGVKPEGFEASLLDSGTYLGIARTEGNWQTGQIAASSLFTEEIFTRARTRVQQETGVSLSAMGNSFKCATHPMQLDQLFKLAIPRVRYSGGGPMDLGYSEGQVSFGGISFATSYLCKASVAYIGDFSKSNTLYTPGGELHIDTEYNGSSMKWIDRKDVGLVFAKAYYNFAVRNPTRFIRISSLTEQTR
jgi:hypothetical protein